MSDWTEYRVMVIDNLKRLERNNESLERHLSELKEEISHLRSSIVEVKTSFRISVLLISVLVSTAVSLVGVFYK